MPLDYAAAYEDAMSPTMLAETPVSGIESDAEPGANWDVIFAHLEARMASLRNWRWSWWAHWAVLARFILPRRYKYLVTANTYDRGLPINTDIIDSTATQAMEICGNGMWSGLTNPARPWFALGVPESLIQLDQAGAEWLDQVQELLYTVLGQSNFYMQMAQLFQDVATFGTSPLIIYEDAENVIRCYLPCAGEYFLGIGARLSVDTLYREFTLSAVNVVEMFGIDACPTEVRNCWMQGGGALETEFIVAHAIEPNFEVSTRSSQKGVRVVPGGFAFREVYWLRGRKTARELSRRGFHERPFFAARWAVTGNDAYGRSLGMNALGDIKQLQVMTIRQSEFVEKLVRPSMGAHVSMKNQPSSVNPAEITYVPTDSPKDGFWPLFEVKPEALTPLTGLIEKTSKRIQDTFYVNVFMAITNMEGVQPRNELELTKRDLERLQQLGPFIEQWETECADPAIKRVLAIMDRKGLLPPKPPSLRNAPVQINYTSMLREAQIAAETAVMERTFAVAGNLSSAAQAAGAPNPIDNVDLDQSLREYGRKTGFPSNCWFSPQQVAQQRAAKAHAAQQQQAMQASLPAVTAAKTLSQTQVGGGQNALGALLGAGQGATQ